MNVCARARTGNTRQYCERSNYYYYIFTFSCCVCPASPFRWFALFFCAFHTVFVFLRSFSLFVFSSLFDDDSYCSSVPHRQTLPQLLLAHISFQPAAIRARAHGLHRSAANYLLRIFFFFYSLESNQVVCIYMMPRTTTLKTKPNARAPNLCITSCASERAVRPQATDCRFFYLQAFRRLLFAAIEFSLLCKRFE